MSNEKPSYINFNKSGYSWKSSVDYRKNPEFYKVGRGEQGVLICEPYKSEIGQYWRFKTSEAAEKSSQKIFKLFNKYLDENDFVGADMSRKYLQMGFTRARRYANYKGGKKYDSKNHYKHLERGTGDPEKVKSAKIFYDRWKLAEANKKYADLKAKWKDEKG